MRKGKRKKHLVAPGGIRCDPLGCWVTKEGCGSCPIIPVCEDFLEMALNAK